MARCRVKECKKHAFGNLYNLVLEYVANPLPKI